MSINLDNVSALELAAITRPSLDKESRNELKPGEYDVSFVQKVTGKLVVNEDTKRKRTCNLLGKRVLALCLHHMGVQESNVGPLLDLILTQAVEGNKDFLDKIEKDPRIVSAMKRLDDRLAKADKLSVKGQIKADLTFTTVDL